MGRQGAALACFRVKVPLASANSSQNDPFVMIPSVRKAIGPTYLLMVLKTHSATFTDEGKTFVSCAVAFGTKVVVFGTKVAWIYLASFRELAW